MRSLDSHGSGESVRTRWAVLVLLIECGEALAAGSSDLERRPCRGSRSDQKVEKRVLLLVALVAGRLRSVPLSPAWKHGERWRARGTEPPTDKCGKARGNVVALSLLPIDERMKSLVVDGG